MPRVPVNHLAAFAVAITAAALVLAGCGGGGSGGGSSLAGSSQLSAQQLAQAEGSLNSVIKASGSSPTLAQMQPVAAQFKALYQAAPNNPETAAGYAVSEAACDSLAFQGSSQTITGALLAASVRGAAEAKAARFANTGRLLALWSMPEVLSHAQSGSVEVKGGDLVPVLSGAPALAARPNDTPIQAQQSFARLDTDLATVETALNVALSNPSYTFTIADPNNPSSANGVKLGSAEFHALYAVVASIRAVLNAGLVYSLDDTNYPQGSQPASTAFAGQLASPGSLVTPAEYLPASPYLTLTPDSSTRIANLKGQLAAGTANGSEAISILNSRNNTGYLFDPGASATSTQFTAVDGEIQAAESYMTGPQMFNLLSASGSQVQTRIDLNAFLSHPPQDLKPLLPTLISGNNNGAELYIDSTSLSNPTFAGLFPDGYPIGALGYAGPSGYAFPIAPTDTTHTVNDVARYAVSWLAAPAGLAAL